MHKPWKLPQKTEFPELPQKRFTKQDTWKFKTDFAYPEWLPYEDKLENQNLLVPPFHKLR